jgi:histone deacetylase 6
MTARLAMLAGGRIVLALEGGYDLEAIARSAAACLRVLLGEAPDAADPGEASPIATRILEAVLRTRGESPSMP